MLGLPLFNALLCFDGTGIIDTLNIEDIVVTEAVDVHALVLVEVGAANVAEDWHGVVLGVLLLGFDGVEPVSYDVGVSYAPRERPEFLHCDEAG